MKVVEKNGEYLEFAGKEIKCQKEFAQKAIEVDVKCFKYLGEKLRGDIEIVKRAIELDGCNLQ